MAAANIVRGTPYPPTNEEGAAERSRRRSRLGDAKATNALSKLNRGAFYANKLPTSAMTKGDGTEGSSHAKREALPNAALVDWAKVHDWQSGGVGNLLDMSHAPGMPKPAVRSAFHVFFGEMLKSVTEDVKVDGGVRMAVCKDAKATWDKMRETDKIKYENTFKADKERYEAEFAAFKQDHPELAKRLQEAKAEAEKRKKSMREAKKLEKINQKQLKKERKKRDADLRRKAKAAVKQAKAAGKQQESEEEVGDSGDEEASSCVSELSESDSEASDDDVATVGARNFQRPSRRICKIVDADDAAPHKKKAKAGGKDAKVSANKDGKKAASAPAAKQSRSTKTRAAAVMQDSDDEEKEDEQVVDEDMFEQLLYAMQSKMAKGKDKKKLRALKETDMEKIAAQIAEAINAGQASEEESEEAPEPQASTRLRKRTAPTASKVAKKAKKSSK